MQQRDSLGYTLIVAAVLCAVCSLAVSTAAVVLRPMQESNEQLDQQLNILDATGLAIGEYGKQPDELDKSQIDELNAWITAKMVDLASGEFSSEEYLNTFKLQEAAQDPELSVEIVNPEFDPGEQRRPKVMKIFIVQRPGSDKIQQVVLPIYGKGLWGTLWGYLAVKSDMETVQGITFFQHKETPGLGGEVDNPRWKAQWDGRRLYDEDGTPATEVAKGPAPPGDPHRVDGLSGATITSRGVTNLLKYWASDDGYGPFLRKMKSQLDGESSS